MDNTICSPNVALQFDNTFTCFSLNELIMISKRYNKWLKNEKICKKDICINLKSINLEKCKDNFCEDPNIKFELWKKLSNNLYPLCKNDESCWLDLNFIKNESKTVKKLKLLTFKPKKIHNEKNWLNTTDIDNVLRQYEHVDKHFKFLGALPSDFYKINNINLLKLNKFKRIGIILNLDGYKQSGSHWVALFIDKTKRQIEYFDSTGNPPNKNIKFYIKMKLLKIFPNYKYLENRFEHQLLDTECGVYSIYYIINRLFGFSFEYITSNIIRDENMQMFRKYIFN